MLISGVGSTVGSGIGVAVGGIGVDVGGTGVNVGVGSGSDVQLMNDRNATTAKRDDIAMFRIMVVSSLFFVNGVFMVDFLSDLQMRYVRLRLLIGRQLALCLLLG